MKIYDCFMFFDEELILDLRLNILDEYVDKFIVTEATYSHSGNKKKLNFNINNYPKFKDKINYIVIDKNPYDLITLDNNKDNFSIKRQNSIKRIELSYNAMREAVSDANAEDIIILSDNDEIPNLNGVNFENSKESIFIFKQKMFYYKFNLLYPSVPWFGSRACKRKNFVSPQWLRNTKQKKYPLWRFDIIFSKKKYYNIFFVEDGGWHFTNVKSPKEIEKKLLNYTHHYEFEQSGLNLKDLKKKIEEKKILYDHAMDQRKYKWGSEKKLTAISLNKMPDYLKENYKKYSTWLEI